MDQLKNVAEMSEQELTCELGKKESAEIDRELKNISGDARGKAKMFLLRQRIRRLRYERRQEQSARDARDLAEFHDFEK